MIKYEDYKNFLNKHFKKFWKTVGPNFSSKKPINQNTILCEINKLITDEKPIAKIFNDYFTSIINHLHIKKSISSKARETLK